MVRSDGCCSRNHWILYAQLVITRCVVQCGVRQSSVLISDGFLVFVLSVFLFLVSVPPPSPLLSAAYRGEIDVVQRMLPLNGWEKGNIDQQYRDIIRKEANARDQWNNTALHVRERMHCTKKDAYLCFVRSRLRLTRVPVMLVIVC